MFAERVESLKEVYASLSSLKKEIAELYQLAGISETKCAEQEEALERELEEVGKDILLLHEKIDAARYCEDKSRTKKLEQEMKGAVGALDLPTLHRAAHAMKGVSLSLGGVRLGALGDRLMMITHDDLAATHDRLLEEITHTAAATVQALEDVRRRYQPPHAVND